jgi:hypothetical protein
MKKRPRFAAPGSRSKGSIKQSWLPEHRAQGIIHLLFEPLRFLERRPAARSKILSLSRSHFLHQTS